MRVAVTGATGFVGRHVVRQLDDMGMTPTLVVRPGPSARDGAGDHPVVELDINEPPRDALDQLGEPDVLIHLAWGGLPHYASPHHLTEELPRQRAFLEGLLGDGLAALTVAGTCFEYGMESGPLREDMPTAPVTAYGKAKDALRTALQLRHDEHPFRLTWARLFYLHGPGQTSGSLIPQLEAAIARGDAAFDMSGGEQQRDYLPVEEAARWLAVLALNGRDNGIVNVCSGQPVRVRDLVAAAASARGSSIHLNLGHFPYPEYEPMAFWGDRSKLDSLSGD